MKNQNFEQVTEELSRLKKNYAELEKKYLEAVEIAGQLTADAEVDLSPNHFRKTLQILRAETEKLRDLYPLQDFLKAKEIEVEKTSQALSALDQSRSEFKGLAIRLKILIQERDELQELAILAEEQFKRHLLRIRTAGLMVPFEVSAQSVSESSDQVAVNFERTPEKEDLRQRPVSLTPTI
jgi:myosin heavy subunit